MSTSSQPRSRTTAVKRLPRGPRPAVLAQRTLLTDDGVRISAVHRRPDPGAAQDVAVVLAHGFTGSWSRLRMRRIIDRFGRHCGVLALDFRGHGVSGGASTVGDQEVLDLHAVLEWARLLGYKRVATVGFSMGASVVVRHAALTRAGTDAVVSVSSPGWWFYRGTPAMRRVHWLIEKPVGRGVGRALLRTRVDPKGWRPVPDAPNELAHAISPVPLLVVHGDRDGYFPTDHAHELYRAAREPKHLWIEAGFGHAEASVGPGLVDRIARWVLHHLASAGTAVPADEEGRTA